MEHIDDKVTSHSKLQISSIRSIRIRSRIIVIFEKPLTGELEICCSGSSKISHFLERIRMEHIDSKVSSDCKLQISSICSIRNRSRI